MILHLASCPISGGHFTPQVEIAAALPTRNWRAIRIKIYEIIGFRRFHISPKPIRDAETYQDYLKRVERDGDKVTNRTSGNRWRDDELEILAERLDAGATQLEIAAALPDRTWEAIRKKIVKLRGPGFDVPETGQLENGETIADYLERNPEAAGAMSLLISENCSPRRPTKMPWLPRPASVSAPRTWLPESG